MTVLSNKLSYLQQEVNSPLNQHDNKEDLFNNIVVDLFLKKEVDDTVIAADKHLFLSFADNSDNFYEELETSSIEDLAEDYYKYYDRDATFNQLVEEDIRWFVVHQYLDYYDTYENIISKYNVILDEEKDTISVELK